MGRVTLFVPDPLRSYFDECPKNKIYFQNIYIRSLLALDEPVLDQRVSSYTDERQSFT